MKYMQLKYFLFIIFYSFPLSTFSMSNLKKLSYYGEVKYEKCDCTNNTFTKHITEPYKREIEQWLLQTAPPEEQQTEAGTTCVECQTPQPITNTEEEEDFFNLITSFFQDAWDWIKSPWEEEEEEETHTKVEIPLPEKKEEKPNFIPSICFQMSGEMENKKPRYNSDFFSCIHKHYDGSDSDSLCSDTVNQPGYPKQCIAIPVTCKDAEDLTLNCKQKFRERDNRERANGCNRGSTYPRRPCLNEDYVSLTAKTFNDIAKCLDVPLDLAFSIFHHESRFLLNNESGTGALCHTQVTGNAIADFNSFLENKPHYQNMETLLPENIEAKCPEHWAHFKKVNTKYNKKYKRFDTRSDYDRCKLTLNPYTCFFYGFSYIKILMYKTEAIAQRVNQIEISEDTHSTRIFWSEEDKQKIEKENNLKLETKKIKIFHDENTLKKILIAVGYNGGPSVIESSFTSFMTDIKKQLANEDNQDMRMALLSTGLDTSSLKDNFQKFLKQNYPHNSQNRREEVANYINKVDENTQQLNNSIQDKYSNVFPNDICPSWEKAAILTY